MSRTDEPNDSIDATVALLISASCLRNFRSVLGSREFSQAVHIRDNLAFIEAQPDAAKILLIVPNGSSVTVKLSRAVQEGATAKISQLLKSYLPAGGTWQYEAAGEFIKEGLHALANGG